MASSLPKVPADAPALARTEHLMRSLLPGLPGLDLSRLRGASAVIAGAGNIGSALAELVAAGGVKLLRLVDRDRVEAKNLVNQMFWPAEVGRSKAEALAARLRQRFPYLQVEAYTADLEDLPLRVFQVDVLLGGLDSRRARQVLHSEIAWPLGISAIDGAVGEGLLGRVQIFRPGKKSGCLECSWNLEDYRHLAAEFPCTPEASAAAPPTLSPGFAGAVVAGIMTAEWVRLLTGQAPPESREIAFDLWNNRFLVSRLRRAPHCRFDHEIVTQTIRLGKDFPAATANDLVGVIERHFGRLPVQIECRRGLLGSGFQSQRFLSADCLRGRANEPLARLGFRRGDGLRIRAAERSAFLILDDQDKETQQ
jgi:molybdopterin/thiamine biosynthesis adenylyltransferase